mmetsp:Transcript_109135/g.260400  ORF Transcript_109135/g.260400 Transcript_109135/m.260400 type:complete len:300 (+) Transcript_109135:538-1437(+)
MTINVALEAWSFSPCHRCCTGGRSKHNPRIVDHLCISFRTGFAPAHHPCSEPSACLGGPHILQRPASGTGNHRSAIPCTRLQYTYRWMWWDLDRCKVYIQEQVSLRCKSQSWDHICLGHSTSSAPHRLHPVARKDPEVDLRKDHFGTCPGPCTGARHHTESRLATSGMCICQSTDCRRPQSSRCSEGRRTRCTLGSSRRCRGKRRPDRNRSGYRRHHRRSRSRWEHCCKSTAPSPSRIVRVPRTDAWENSPHHQSSKGLEHSTDTCCTPPRSRCAGKSRGSTGSRRRGRPWGWTRRHCR